MIWTESPMGTTATIWIGSESTGPRTTMLGFSVAMSILSRWHTLPRAVLAPARTVLSHPPRTPIDPGNAFTMAAPERMVDIDDWSGDS
jgi:hypothetical protein